MQPAKAPEKAPFFLSFSNKSERATGEPTPADMNSVRSTTPAVLNVPQDNEFATQLMKRIMDAMHVGMDAEARTCASKAVLARPYVFSTIPCTS